MTRYAHQSRRISREHAEVRRGVAGIRREIARLRGESGPQHEVGRLSSLLLGLREHLRRHFELEEQEGFLVDDLELDPGTERTIELLLRQHWDLDRELAALVDAAERAKEGRTGLPESFVQGLREFLGRLLEHESAEDELVLSRVLHDEGGGD